MFALLLALTLGTPAQPAQLRLVADTAAVAPGGTFRAGVLFRLEPGWHIYWRSSGQAGLPTEIAWTVQRGTPGALTWPAPQLFRESKGFITTYGYADEVLLFSEIRVASQGRRAVEIEARADYLVCKVDCIPGRATLRHTVGIGPARRSPDRALFERFAALVPRPAAGARATFEPAAVVAGAPFRASVRIPATERATLDAPDAESAFVPDLPATLPPSAVRVRPEAGGLLVEVEGQATPDAPSAPERLGGVLRLRDAAGRPAHLGIDVPIPRAAPVAAVAAPAGGPSMWEALLFALLGGLLLNVMPCVFPVLAIKVHGVAKIAREKGMSPLSHAFAYAGGIAASMLVLALAVIGLRFSGVQVGWGFQFQEPAFVAAMSLALVVFALNLFGVFEIGATSLGLGPAAARTSGRWRSFWEGVLAVALATPCSAPFLGSAAAFALQGNAGQTLLVFQVIGLGLAGPFVLLVSFPALLRRLPRPGAWMERVRQLLGFAVLGTVVWLLWVFGKLTDLDGAAALVAVLLAAGLASWIYGSFRAESRLGRIAVLLAAVGVVAGAWAFFLPSSSPSARTTAARAPCDPVAQGWCDFDEAAVDAALRAGRAVFVDFTADWCLTCKVNERLVLGDPQVREAIRAQSVATFRADWTRRDERIRALLLRHGRAGVPLYLVYRPGAADRPEVLPELLTMNTVLGALRRATGPQRGESP
jgi:thiol:disulfide interchange protein DsbD